VLPRSRDLCFSEYHNHAINCGLQFSECHNHTITCGLQAVSEGLKGYEVDPKTRAELDQQLRHFAREKVEVRVREAANTALSRMRDRWVPPTTCSM
jgi:hypothetical protein